MGVCDLYSAVKACGAYVCVCMCGGGVSAMHVYVDVGVWVRVGVLPYVKSNLSSSLPVWGQM